jgi:hypothetical protein
LKSTLAALAILLVLTSGFYWKLTLTSDWTFLEAPDLAIQVRPWLDFAAREFHAGRLPMWDPYEWAGHTLIGQVQPGIANPLNWILFAMPLRDGHIPISTLHWYWVLIHWLGAVFTWALCRDLGASFWALDIWRWRLYPDWLHGSHRLATNSAGSHLDSRDPHVLLTGGARPPSAGQRGLLRRLGGSSVPGHASRDTDVHGAAGLFALAGAFGDAAPAGETFRAVPHDRRTSGVRAGSACA